MWSTSSSKQNTHFSTSPGSSNQLLSPECWKVTLRVLGCLPPTRSSRSKGGQALSTSDVSSRTAGPPASPYRAPISLSPQQVTNVGVVDNRLKHHNLVIANMSCVIIFATNRWMRQLIGWVTTSCGLVSVRQTSAALASTLPGLPTSARSSPSGTIWLVVWSTCRSAAVPESQWAAVKSWKVKLYKDDI